MTYPVTREYPTVSASIDYMVEFWAKPWSIYDQLDTMRECIEEIEGVNFLCEVREHDEEIGPIYDALNGFGVFLPVVDLDMSIESAYRICMDTLREVHTDAEERLASELDPERLVTYFSFPSSIRIACEQYLVYFSQFLIDVGVNAEADLTSAGGMTLFKVKPKDTEHALNDIRELLSAYLQIGTDVNVDVTAYGNRDASVFQLQSNVLHLRGQLALAAAVIEAKEATIENLRLSVYARQSMHTAPKQNQSDLHKPNDEVIFGGIVRLSEWESGKGLTVNFAEIARKMKRIIGR